MEAPDFAAKPMVESMRSVVVGVAIEHHDVALHFSCLFLCGGDQRSANAAIAVIGMHHQVVDLGIIATPHFGAKPQAREARESTIDITAEDAIMTRFSKNLFIASLQGFTLDGGIHQGQQIHDLGHRLQAESANSHGARDGMGDSSRQG